MMSHKWRASSQAKDDDDDSAGSDDDGDDDDDHHHDDHQENDFYDDDDNDNEMMITALTVTWVNCGKVGGLYYSMVQYCNVMKIKHNITFLISFSSPQKAHQV